MNHWTYLWCACIGVEDGTFTQNCFPLCVGDEGLLPLEVYKVTTKQERITPTTKGVAPGAHVESPRTSQYKP